MTGAEAPFFSDPLIDTKLFKALEVGRYDIVRCLETLFDHLFSVFPY